MTIYTREELRQLEAQPFEDIKTMVINYLELIQAVERYRRALDVVERGE